MASHKKPRVVIVGAGFGGLTAALSLAAHPIETLLIDRNNYHTFLALLYQVAAAELEPEEIAYPVRTILRKKPGIRFTNAEIRKIDLSAKAVKTDDMVVPYDFLILASGSVSCFFGISGAAEYTFSLKTLEHGIALRNQILSCFEQAVHATNVEQRKKLMTFTIVGGGATGVEFAGALAELVHGPLMKDYPELNFHDVRVILLQAANSLLPELPERLQNYALARLYKMGVEVYLQSIVNQVTREAVYTADGRTIHTGTVIWTAGVCGDTLAQTWGLPARQNGQIVVLPTLQAPDNPDIYVIGDLAYVVQDGRPLPMVAPVAIQQGESAAQNIMRQAAGSDPLPFHYRDKGSMVTIGRNAATVCIGRRTFTGFIAWVIWLSVHLLKLIGFRNRLLVLINWAWDYLLYERAVRIILPSKR